MAKEAVEMYNKAAKWAEAYKLAAEFLGTDETQEMYLQKAEELERAGRLKEAEDVRTRRASLPQVNLFSCTSP